MQGEERLETELYGHYFRFGASSNYTSTSSNITSTPESSSPELSRTRSGSMPDLSGCDFSRETRHLHAQLPEWISPICFFNHLHHMLL